MTAHSIPSAEPNVTPMIDVLLVLLIVFMVAVVQVHQTLDAQLPQPCVGACETGDVIVLEILPGPAYQINHHPIASASLLQQLATIYQGRPQKIIQIAGHSRARYEDVVAAMDIAKSAGVRVMSIAPKAILTSR